MYFFNKLMALIVGSMLFLNSVASAYTLEETVKRQLELASGSTVIVENVNGKVLIEGWDKEQIFIEAVKKVQAGSKEKAGRLLEKVEIEIQERSGEIFIKTHQPDRDSGFLDWIFGNDASASVTYTIYVPQNSNLDITTTNGSVEVAGVEGELALETVNGRIDAENVAGDVSGHTVNGSITADFRQMPASGELAFSTTNGSIKLYVPPSSAFEIRANTTNGSINTDFPMQVNGKFTSKRLRGEINGGGPLVVLETTNGSINIHER